jgi:tetratricopeptide (TPR) repeat protein
VTRATTRTRGAHLKASSERVSQRASSEFANVIVQRAFESTGVNMQDSRHWIVVAFATLALSCAGAPPKPEPSAAANSQQAADAPTSEEIFGVSKAPGPPPDASTVYAGQIAWLELLRAHDFAGLEHEASVHHDKYLTHAIDGDHYWSQFSLFRTLGLAYEADVDAWVTAMPNSGIALMARSLTRTKLAFVMRGGRYLADTQPEQLAKFCDYLQRAAVDANAAKQRLGDCPLCVHALVTQEFACVKGDVARTQAAQELIRHPDLWRIVYWINTGLEPRWSGSYDRMKSFDEWLAKQFPGSDVARFAVALALFDMSMSLAERGQNGPSLQLLQRSLAMYPTADAIERRILIDAARKDYGAVDRDIDFVREKGWFDLHLFSAIGTAEAKRGRWPQAKAEFERVLLIDPDESSARRNLERVLAAGKSADEDALRAASASDSW